MFTLLRIKDVIQCTAKVAILFNRIELKRIGRKAVQYETDKTEDQTGQVEQRGLVVSVGRDISQRTDR